MGRHVTQTPDDVEGPSRVTLGVTVELPPGFAQLAEGEGAAAFRESLAPLLDDLIGDLEIPAAVDLTIRQSNGTQFSSQGVHVLVDDHPCRWRSDAISDVTTDPRALARAIAASVVNSRELLISPQVVQRLAAMWRTSSDDDVSDSSVGAVGAVARGLVKRGVRVPPGPVSLDQGVDEIVESVIAQRQVPPLTVWLSTDLQADIWTEAAEAPRPYTLRASLSEVQAASMGLLFNDLGLVLPEIQFDTDSALHKHEFRIQLNDLRLAPMPGLMRGEAIVSGIESVEALLGVRARKVSNPITGLGADVAVFSHDQLERLRDAGADITGPEGFVVMMLLGEIRRNAGSLLLSDAVAFHVAQLREQMPTLTRAALTKVPLFSLTGLLRRLLDEDVSIRDLAWILEGVLEVDGSVSVNQSTYRLVTPHEAALQPRLPGAHAAVANLDDLADCIRRHLRAQMSEPYAPSGRVSVIVVEPSIEARLRESLNQPLTDEESERYRAAVVAASQPLRARGVGHVLLTNSEVRRPLRRLIETELPALPVLSYGELAPRIQYEALARITSK